MSNEPECPEAQQATTMDSGRLRFQRGFTAGREGRPCPEDGSPQAHLRGAVERRGRRGEAVVVVCAATRCVKCGQTNWGLRGGCSCWPDGGWNFDRNALEGYRVDWGAIVLPVGDSIDGPFMSYTQLLAERTAGRDVISDTGEPIRFEGSTETTDTTNGNSHA